MIIIINNSVHLRPKVHLRRRSALRSRQDTERVLICTGSGFGANQQAVLLNRLSRLKTASQIGHDQLFEGRPTRTRLAGVYVRPVSRISFSTSASTSGLGSPSLVAINAFGVSGIKGRISAYTTVVAITQYVKPCVGLLL